MRAVVDLACAIEVDKRRSAYYLKLVQSVIMYIRIKNIQVENSIFKSALLQNSSVLLKRSAQRTRTFRSFIFDAIDKFFPKVV